MNAEHRESSDGTATIVADYLCNLASARKCACPVTGTTCEIAVRWASRPMCTDGAMNSDSAGAPIRQACRVRRWLRPACRVRRRPRPVNCGDFQRKGLIDVSEVLVVLFRQIRQVSSDVLRRKGRTTSSESPSFSGVESAEALRARFTFRVRFTCLVRVCIVHLHHCGCMFSSLYCCACGLIRECQRGDSTSTGTGLEPHTHGLQD